MKHTTCHVIALTGALLFGLLPGLCAAQSDIDRAFDMQNAPVRSRLSVDSGVKDAQRNAQSDVADRYAAQERARAEAMRSNGSTTSNSSTEQNNSASTAGTWKVVKQYEGGFADFGLDVQRTLYVVRCGNGTEYKMYRDKHGLWGSTGLGPNNESATLEDAARKKCK